MWDNYCRKIKHSFKIDIWKEFQNNKPSDYSVSTANPIKENPAGPCEPERYMRLRQFNLSEVAEH